VFYYITVMNENYQQPEMPKGIEEDIIKGMYLLDKGKGKDKLQLLGSGTILREVQKAAEILRKDYKIESDVWSVTSFNELRREASLIARENTLNPGKKAKLSHVESCLGKVNAPVIAATDYMRLFADQIREYVPSRYITLGTDGFGRSDTRKALRHYFEVDAKHIVYTSLHALFLDGKIEQSVLTKAKKSLGINAEKIAPLLG